ncbi:MAG: hypothetical protein MJZ06_07310 [Bacteroidaceae bacterium]|nr:hypothetical protein [Bacteroidaceae bacterium]
MFSLFRPKTAGFDQIGIRTDWHCHLLPRVDDGVQDLGRTVRILDDMRRAGYHTIVHTPHFNPELFPANTEDSMRDAFERYRENAPSTLELKLAGEYMVYDGFEKRDMSQLLQIEPGKVLIEMSYLYPSATMEQAIFSILMAGLTPVIAHPERYLYYADTLDRFDRLHELGAQFQLNLLSLQGVYGPKSVQILEYILDKGWYSYLGTDTHSVHHFRGIVQNPFKAKYLPQLQAIAR